MSKKASPKQTFFCAVCWTAAAAAFSIGTALTERGSRLFVLRLLTAALAIANAVIWWNNTRKYSKMKQEEQNHE